MISTNLPNKVPESVVRGTAFEVFAIAIFTIAFQSPWPVLVLTIDFAARAFLKPQLSPLAMLSKHIWVPLFNVKGPLIFYTPKRFAARIGFMMSSISALLFFINLQWIGTVLISVLALFSLLEGAFAYCVGCKIYGFLVGRGWINSEDCPDCVS